MKIVKIMMSFAVIAGLLVFFLTDPFNWFHGEWHRNVVISQDVVEKYRKQFTNEWDSVGDWDNTLFHNHCDIVIQLSAQNSDIDVTPLWDMNTATSVEIVYDRIFHEWGKSDCKHKVVCSYKAAVDTICSVSDGANKNPTVKIIYAVNNVYYTAYKLAHSSIGYGLVFDGEIWNGSNFNKYCQSKLSQRDSILNNTYYKQYLINIDSIAKGLAGLDTKIEKAREKYYGLLEKKIIEKYDSIPSGDRTRQQWNTYKSLRDRYDREYTNRNSGSDKKGELDKHIDVFGEDVRSNEQSNSQY